MKESDLCTQYMKFYDSYPEIRGIDIVTVKDNKLTAVEAKLKPTLHQLEQLYTRTQYHSFDYYIALIPDESPSPFYISICKNYGFGIHALSDTGILEILAPRLYQRKNNDILDILTPEARNHTVPGKPSCKHWSKYKVLEQKYIKYILEHGPTKLETVMEVVEPEAIGKRGKLLVAKRDQRAAFILYGSWKSLKIEDGILQSGIPQRMGKRKARKLARIRA